MGEALSAGEATAELLKELVAEVRTLREKVTSLEQQNSTLTKAMDDPATMMQKAGWLRAVTPMADEAFDPLHRDQNDEQVFGYNSDMLTKSDHQQELHEWREMESKLPNPSSPSAKRYR